MVVLTVVAPSNDYTIYLKHPLPRQNYIRLISCSLYNSWHNLKSNSAISLFNQNQNKPKTMLLFQGHYTLKTLAKEIENALSRHGLHLQTGINQPVGQMVIDNPDKKIVLGSDLAELLGIESNLLLKHLSNDCDRQALTSLTVTWLTRSKTCATVHHRVFWLDLTSKGNHTKK